MSSTQPDSCLHRQHGTRGSYAKRHEHPAPKEMTHVPECGQWMDGRSYSLDILQNPERGRTCGFGDKDRRPIAPALIAKLVAKNPDGSPVAPEEIDPSFFIVMVDLWSGDGTQERSRVLNLTPREKVHRGAIRQGTHGSRPDSTSEPTTIAPLAPHDPSIYSSLFSPLETTSGHGGSSTTSLHMGSHHASPIGASPGSSSQQLPIPTSPWGATAPSQYAVPPLAPSHTALAYSAQAMPPLFLGYPTYSTASPSSSAHHLPIDPQFAIGAPHILPTTGQAYSYGPTASPPQAGPSVQPSGQYAPVDPREVYQTLIGTSISTGVHIKDDEDQTDILFVFADLSVRTEGIFRLRLRLSNIGSFTPADGRAWTINTGKSLILAQTFSEPFQVYNPKNFPGVPAITELSKAVGIQGQKIPKRTKPTTGGGTSRSGPSKKRKQRRHESDEDDEEWNGGDALDDD